MRRFLAVCFAVVLIGLLPVLPVYAGQPSQAAPKSSVPPPGVTVPCGNTQVPYFVYSMAISQPETLQLTFQASGAGLITFTANNYQTLYWARTDGSCGNCTLTIPDVQPGSLGTLQLAADAAADACPSSGLTVSNFQLQILPPSLNR